MRKFFNVLIANILNYKSIGLVILITLTNISIASFVQAGPVNWEEVEPSEAGRQWVDLGSIKINKDGNFNVLSRFEVSSKTDQQPKKSSLFVMQINCSKNIFRDTYVNGIPKFSSEWHSGDGDSLIINVLNKVCSPSTS